MSQIGWMKLHLVRVFVVRKDKRSHALPQEDVHETSSKQTETTPWHM